jgi:hypothetical protein
MLSFVVEEGYMKNYAIQLAVIAALTAVSSGLVGCGGGDDATGSSGSTNSTPPAVNTMTGNWNGQADGGVYTFSMSLTQSGNVLSGTYVLNGGGSGPATGEITGNTLDLTTVREPGHNVSQWHGTVNSDLNSASGTYTNITAAGGGTFSMSK